MEEKMKDETNHMNLIQKAIAGFTVISAISGIGGCVSAPYYYDDDWKSKKLKAESSLESEFGEKPKTALTKIYSPSTLSKKYETIKNDKTLSDCTQIIEQSELADKFLKETSNTGYIAKAVSENTNVSSDSEDEGELQTTITNLFAKVSAQTNTQRNALAKKYEKNETVLNVLKENEQKLILAENVFNAIASIYCLEGNLPVIVDAQEKSAKIHELLTGQNQYSVGQTKFESLQNMNLNQLCNKNSKVMQSYEPAQKLSDVYKDIKQKITDEYKSWNRDSLHNICNEHIANALNVVNGAHLKAIINDSEFQAVIKYVTKDLADLQTQKEENSSFGTFFVTTGNLIATLTGYRMFSESQRALSRNKYSPDGDGIEVIIDAITRGNQIKGGWKNAEHYIGSNEKHRWMFAGSTLSLAAASATGLALAYEAGLLTTEASIIGGGIIIGPGAGN